MLDIKGSADYLSRSGTFTNFSMLFADASYKSSWSTHATSQGSQGYGSNTLSAMSKSSLDAHTHLRQPDPYQMFGPTSSRLANSDPAVAVPAGATERLEQCGLHHLGGHERGVQANGPRRGSPPLGRAQVQAQHELRQAQPGPQILLRQEHNDEGARQKICVQVRFPRAGGRDPAGGQRPRLQVPERPLHELLPPLGQIVVVHVTSRRHAAYFSLNIPVSVVEQLGRRRRQPVLAAHHGPPARGVAPRLLPALRMTCLRPQSADTTMNPC